ELSPDKLIILPSYVPPHKAAAEASAPDRLEMARLAFSFDERVEISDYEIARGGDSYSYLTVEHFAGIYQEAELYFLIGGDSLFDFDGWKHPEIIAKKAKIAVVSRGQFTEKLVARSAAFEKTYGYKPKMLSFTGDVTSSTYVRYCLMLGCEGENIPQAVSDYIRENGLYQGDELFGYVREHLKEKRLLHTAGVIECALKLNGQKSLRLDRDKVVTASLLHDVAKYMRPEDFPSFVPPDELPRSVVHAFLGEYVAKTVLGISDEDVLSAIRYHTTGRPDMTALEKLVYTADLLERNRDYPGVKKLRELTERDFEKGFRECMLQGYKRLKQMLMPGGIYYLSAKAYEYYSKN
ncbi:MAG: bis(5'-nucleosyl)-tetraphosphatase (symmetrical) YqeK, partial [Clostridia bacterium]|nr:bis(5'-nucleosyl)-tetraphosphatase (symmetrical) YqeK [Clostridia bacterium]